MKNYLKFILFVFILVSQKFIITADCRVCGATEFEEINEDNSEQIITTSIDNFEKIDVQHKTIIIHDWTKHKNYLFDLIKKNKTLEIHDEIEELLLITKGKVEEFILDIIALLITNENHHQFLINKCKDYIKYLNNNWSKYSTKQQSAIFKLYSKIQ